MCVRFVAEQEMAEKTLDKKNVRAVCLHLLLGCLQLAGSLTVPDSALFAYCNKEDPCKRSPRRPKSVRLLRHRAAHGTR